MNAREGIKTHISGQLRNANQNRLKTMNAREGIKTNPRKVARTHTFFPLKTMNAREGIKTHQVGPFQVRPVEG